MPEEEGGAGSGGHQTGGLNDAGGPHRRSYAAAVPPRRASKLWLLLPVLLALAWFWPTLWHGFRSDDFLTVYYWDRHAHAVHWDRVFAEFGRAWFGVRDIYRPLVSVSYGVNLQLSPDPFGWHLLNVLLLGVTASCTAALAALHCARLPRLAGLIAGAADVLHPAAVEPTAWIAARTSGLQVALGVAAMLAFARHLRGRGRRWPYVVLTALALLTKEGAVMLPVSLLMLDLLHRVGRTWAERWRLHGPVLVLVAGYLVFRKLLLGWFGTAESGHGVVERASNLFTHGGLLVVPPLADGAQWALVLLPVAAIVLAVMDVWPARSVLFAIWIGALLLPTSHMASSAAAFDGRFLYDAVPVVALFLALAVDARKQAGSARNALLFALVLVGGYFAAGSRQWLDRYGEQDATVRAVQHQVLAAAHASAPGRPFGIGGLPGLPLLQTKLWGVLGLEPFTTVERPLVGVPEIVARDDAAWALFGDAAPVHAMAELGAGVAIWQPAANTVVPVARPTVAEVELVASQSAPGAFVPGSPPLLATAVAAVQVVVSKPASRFRLRLLDDLSGDFAFGWREVRGAPTTTAWFDLTRALPPLVQGGCSGLAIEIDGEPAPAGTVVRARGSLATGPLLSVLAGRVVPRDALDAVLRPPRHDLALRLYLLLPTGLLSADVLAGTATRLDAATQNQIGFAADVLGGCLVHCFWQTLPDHPGEPWRSPIDWFAVR